MLLFSATYYLYTKKNTPKKGKVIVLNGVSRSGKTSLANCLVKLLGPSWEKVERDDFVAQIFMDKMNGKISQDQFLCRMRKQTDAIYKKIKDLVHSGKHVILDTVLSGPEGKKTIKQAFEKLQDFDVCLVLVYCPLHVIIQRLKEMNKKAYLQDDIRELRPVFATLQFLSLYRPKKYDTEISLGSLSCKDIEIGFRESKKECEDVIARLKKVKSHFFSQFCFDKNNTLKIVPRLAYDLIIDTSKHDKQTCAQMVYDFIRANNFRAFEVNYRT